jgi:hypothetical protein
MTEKDEEIERNPEEVLRRMLNTQPKFRKDIKGTRRQKRDEQESSLKRQ